MNYQISRQKLKPCPFCGSDKIRLTNWGLYRCWCANCLAQAADEISKKDAVEAWNKRVDQPPADQWIPCSFDIPKDGQHIIATFESNKGVKQVTEEHFHKSFLKDPWKMIAWYPFPEPYKGE